MKRDLDRESKARRQGEPRFRRAKDAKMDFKCTRGPARVPGCSCLVSKGISRHRPSALGGLDLDVKPPSYHLLHLDTLVVHRRTPLESPKSIGG